MKHSDIFQYPIKKLMVDPPCQMLSVFEYFPTELKNREEMHYQCTLFPSISALCRIYCGSITGG